MEHHHLSRLVETEWFAAAISAAVNNSRFRCLCHVEEVPPSGIHATCEATALAARGNRVMASRSKSHIATPPPAIVMARRFPSGDRRGSRYESGGAPFTGVTLPPSGQPRKGVAREVAPSQIVRGELCISCPLSPTASTCREGLGNGT